MAHRRILTTWRIWTFGEDRRRPPKSSRTGPYEADIYVDMDTDNPAACAPPLYTAWGELKVSGLRCSPPGLAHPVQLAPPTELDDSPFSERSLARMHEAALERLRHRQQSEALDDAPPAPVKSWARWIELGRVLLGLACGMAVFTI